MGVIEIYEWMSSRRTIRAPLEQAVPDKRTLDVSKRVKVIWFVLSASTDASARNKEFEK